MLGDDDDTSDNRRLHLSHVVLALQRQLDDTHAQLRRINALSYQKSSLLDTGRIVLQQHCSATQKNRAEGATATIEIHPSWKGWELRAQIHGPFHLVNHRSRMSIAVVHPQQSISCIQLSCDVAAACETSIKAAAMLRAAVHLPFTHGEASSSVLHQQSSWEGTARVYVMIMDADGNASAVYAGSVHIDPKSWLQALAQTTPPPQMPQVPPDTTQAFKKGPALEIDACDDIEIISKTLEGRMLFTKKALDHVSEMWWHLEGIAEAQVVFSLSGVEGDSKVRVVFSAVDAGLLPLLKEQLILGMSELASQKGKPPPQVLEEERQGSAIQEKESFCRATDALVSELAAMKAWVGALQATHAAQDSVYRVHKQPVLSDASIAELQNSAIEAMMESDAAVAAALSPPTIL